MQKYLLKQWWTIVIPVRIFMVILVSDYIQTFRNNNFPMHTNKHYFWTGLSDKTDWDFQWKQEHKCCIWRKKLFYVSII